MSPKKNTNMVKKDEKVTVICDGGWKYIGKIERLQFSPLGALLWIELDTKQTKIKIHSKYVVTIIQAK